MSGADESCAKKRRKKETRKLHSEWSLMIYRNFSQTTPWNRRTDDDEFWFRVWMTTDDKDIREVERRGFVCAARENALSKMPYFNTVSIYCGNEKWISLNHSYSLRNSNVTTTTTFQRRSPKEELNTYHLKNKRNDNTLQFTFNSINIICLHTSQRFACCTRRSNVCVFVFVVWRI